MVEIGRAHSQYGFVGAGHDNCIKTDHHHSSTLGTHLTSVSANMLHVAYLQLSGIPTAEPGVGGVVWRDGTDLKISACPMPT